MRSGEIIVLLVAQPVVGKPRIKLFRACGPAERVSGGTGLCVRGWEGACPWLVGWSCALVSVCVLSFVSAFVCSFRGLLACVLSWVEIFTGRDVNIR